MVLRHLPFARTVAGRYVDGHCTDEQFLEAALLGLLRAVESLEPAQADDFEAHAEPYMVRELDALVEDAVCERTDRIRQRDQAAARAISRIAQMLEAREDIQSMARSLGRQPRELASAMLTTILTHPAILSAGAARPER